MRAVRYRSVWCGSDAIFPEAIRRHDRGRDRYLQNGPRGQTNLRPDAGTEMGDRHGRLCLVRGHVPQLSRSSRNRSTSSGGRLRQRLSASSGSSSGGTNETTAQDRGRKSGCGPEEGLPLGLTLTFSLGTFSRSDGRSSGVLRDDWRDPWRARQILLADKLRASGLERTEVSGSRARNVAYRDEGFLRIRRV